jgi:hypothetical protein
MRTRHLRKSIVSTVVAALVASTAAFAAPDSTAQFHYYKVKSPVARGLQAHVVVDATPAGLCRITVSKGGIQMQAKRIDRWGLGLYPKRSKSVDDYRVAWTWRVPPKSTLGLWRVRVNCGRAGILQKTFTVIR